MCTILTGSNPPTLMLGELKLFISLFLTNWNIKHPTRVPDCHDHAASTLDLFFTTNPQNYTYTVSSPLGSSDHCTVSVTISFTPPPPIPPTQHHLWYFWTTRRADMNNFLLDFPWNDYCFWTRDPDLAATAVGGVVDSRMRTYTPIFFKNFLSF